MSERKSMNGTPEQYRAFYRERVPLSRTALLLETQAILGFNFEQLISDVKFPTSFWTGLQGLIKELTEKSLKSVGILENKVAADKLLAAFGDVTTVPTIEPHKELSERATETQGTLQLTITESKFIFAAILQKVEQMVISFHETALAEIPSEEDDKTVAQYLQTSESTTHQTVRTSVSQSQRKFASLEKKRKEKRKKLRKSYGMWMERVRQIKQLIFEGNASMQTELNLSVA